MININSTIDFPSQVFPGVVFTLRRPTDARRAALLLASAEARKVIKTLGVEGDLAMERKDNDRITEIPAHAKAVMNATIEPMVIKWAWVGVAGLTIDGQPPDVESFICNSPSPLVKECYTFAASLHERTDMDVSLPTVDPMYATIN
jgi:hypothetical protein